MPMAPRNQRLTIAAIGVCYAAAGLAVSLALFPIGDLAVESDFFSELGPAAQRLARGEVAVANHPYKGPLQPALTALVHGVGSPFGLSWYRSGVVVSLLAAVALLIAVRQLAMTVAGPRVALAAVLLTAGSTLAFVQAHKAASDMLFAALATGTVAMALALAARPADQERWLMTGRWFTVGRWFIVGILAGLAFLTRYVGAILPVWALAVAWTAPRTQRGRAVLAGAAGFGLLAGPWLLVNLIQADALLATRNAENLAAEFGPSGSGADLVAHYLVNLPTRLVDTLGQGLGWVQGGAALLGLIMVLVARPPGPWRALLGWAAAYLAMLALLFFRPRFALPLVPVTALVTAWVLLGGPGQRGPWWARHGARHGPRLGWIVVAVLILAAVPRTVATVRFFAAEQPRHLAGVIDHLAEHATDPPPVVMARKAHAPFHAGVPWRPYPVTQLDARSFLARARERGAGLVLVGPIERTFASVAFELDHLGELTGVDLIYADSANTLLRLDAATAADELGRDPAMPGLRQLVMRHLRHDEPAEALRHGLVLARRQRAVGDLKAATTTLEKVLAAAAPLGPTPDALVARVELAWIAVLAGQPALGLAALAPAMADLATQPDRRLEGQGCEYLGLLRTMAGQPELARPLLERAALLYDQAQRPADARRARALIRTLPR